MCLWHCTSWLRSPPLSWAELIHKHMKWSQDWLVPLLKGMVICNESNFWINSNLKQPEPSEEKECIDYYISYVSIQLSELPWTHICDPWHFMWDKNTHWRGFAVSPHFTSEIRFLSTRCFWSISQIKLETNMRDCETTHINSENTFPLRAR